MGMVLAEVPDPSDVMWLHGVLMGESRPELLSKQGCTLNCVCDQVHALSQLWYTESTNKDFTTLQNSLMLPITFWSTPGWWSKWRSGNIQWWWVFCGTTCGSVIDARVWTSASRVQALPRLHRWDRGRPCTSAGASGPGFACWEHKVLGLSPWLWHLTVFPLDPSYMLLCTVLSPGYLCPLADGAQDVKGVFHGWRHQWQLSSLDQGLGVAL